MKELRELYNWMCEMDKLDKKPNFYDIKIKAVNLLNKQQEAINYTHCCEPFFCADEKQNGSNQRCEKQCDSGCKD